MTALPEFVEPAINRPVTSPAVLMAYSMNDFRYFDIETLPDQREGILEKYRKEVTPPANIKKQESIDIWMAEKAEQAAIEMLGKTSFDGGAGHVCTIGWAVNDGDVRVEHAEDIGEEADILRAFFSDFCKYKSTTLVGHNSNRFDIPFLMKRAVILGVELPDDRAFPRDPKPWDRNTFDTMTAWAGARDMISMNKLCGILGIVGKGNFDGSQVAEAWANGEHMTIAEYCDDDVRRTRAIHQKFLAAGF